jgi:hypothetical protein
MTGPLTRVWLVILRCGTNHVPLAAFTSSDQADAHALRVADSVADTVLASMIDEIVVCEFPVHGLPHQY